MDFVSSHNKMIEAIVDVICARTGNSDRAFFRPVIVYFFSKVASNLRANISTRDMGIIPLNNYAICLGPSGYGKNHSISIVEDELLKGFKTRFTKELLPNVAKDNLNLTAELMDSYNHAGIENNLEALLNDYAKSGEFFYSFDNGTTPAIKQLRNKLILAGAGAISSEQDELGSNLANNTEILNLLLELYDLGKVKQKLVKNTAENQRSIDLDGRVPTNLLMFGTPTKIFDGDEIENRFINFLETGYARRCIFGYGSKIRGSEYFDLSAEEHFRRKVMATSSDTMQKLSKYFEDFADRSHHNITVTMPDSLSIKLIEYRLDCEKRAESLQNHEEIKKAELEHRYFKTLKLTGTLAFIKEHTEVTEEDLNEAITLIEESGQSFNKFLTRAPNYVRLANFIADKQKEVTNADIAEALPWYKTPTKRRELMTLAKAWGYNHNLVIKEEIRDGVEFFSTTKLTATDMKNIIISHSSSVADNYRNVTIDFDNLNEFCTNLKANFNWCNHHFNSEDGKDSSFGHRHRDYVRNYFNCVVLDIDSGTSIETFKDVFKDYTYYLHTTKRHTEKNNRFRVIIPLKYKLSLPAEVYKEFMTNILNTLPFEIDSHSCCPETKWSTYYGSTGYTNKAELFDPLPFIPKTSRNAELNMKRADLKKLDKIQAWFVTHVSEGNRNNMMFRYAVMLLDAGKSYEDIEKAVFKLNNMIKLPLPEEEIQSTVMHSIAMRLNK